MEGRCSRGLSRLRFAVFCGLSESVVAGIESGMSEPQHLSLAKIAVFLNIDLASLIEWHGVSQERQKFPLLLLTAQAKKGLTNQQLAQAIGVSGQTISFYHAGRTQPEDVEVIQRLSEVLDIDFEELKAAWCWKKLNQASREQEDGKLYCSRCHAVKEKSEFHSYGAGYFSTCKKCREEVRQKKLSTSDKN